MAVEVFAGNTGDPATVASQVNKIRERFGVENVALVGGQGNDHHGARKGGF